MGKATRRTRGLIFIAALVALVLCTASPAHAGSLKRGAKGPRVAFVQKVLGLHVDRIYGKQTKRAVKRFQRSPRADRRRRRRPRDVERAQARPRALERRRRASGAGPCGPSSARSASPPTESSGRGPTPLSSGSSVARA